LLFSFFPRFFGTLNRFHLTMAATMDMSIY
jgi:hypothetical protein